MITGLLWALAGTLGLILGLLMGLLVVVPLVLLTLCGNWGVGGTPCSSADLIMRWAVALPGGGVIGGLAGAGMAYGQTKVAVVNEVKLERWVRVTAISAGLVAEIILVSLLSLAVSGRKLALPDELSGPILFLAFALAIGIGQWATLRRVGVQILWWIPATALAWLPLAIIIGLAIKDESRLTLFDYLSMLTIWFVTQAVLGANLIAGIRNKETVS